MSKYSNPQIYKLNEQSEGVYAASGIGMRSDSWYEYTGTVSEYMGKNVRILFSFDTDVPDDTRLDEKDGLGSASFYKSGERGIVVTGSVTADRIKIKFVSPSSLGLQHANHADVTITQM